MPYIGHIKSVTTPSSYMSSEKVAPMAKKVTINNLASAIEDVLSDYGDEVRQNMAAITKSVTQQGVKALRSESAETFGTTAKRKKKYAKTWTSSFTSGRVSSHGTIYNTQPGLPHLLENGHVSKNGTGRVFGFVPGRNHIEKVEKKLESIFEREVKSKL